MVSVKSLAVLLFAAAVTAAPQAGRPQGINLVDSSVACPEQDQKVYCCNELSESKKAGSHTTLFDDVLFECNSGSGAGWAINPVTGTSQCTAKAACCSDKTKQNGFANGDLSCVAFPGVN